MELSQEDYNKLLEKAKGILFRADHIDPHEIVSEVVLEALEKGELPMLHVLMKSVMYKAKLSGHNTVGQNSHKHHHQVLKNSKISKSEQTRVCKKCNEPLPISAFNTVRRKVKSKQSKDAYNFIHEVLYNKKIANEKLLQRRG